MNKTELIDAISTDTGLTRRQSESALDAIVFQVTAGVWAGTPVRITGFGTFKLRERSARQGRNPQTGAAVKIKASKGIGFTPGLGLKADLNARRAPKKPVIAAALPAATRAPSVVKALTKAAPARKSAGATKKSAPAKKAVATKSAASKSTAAKKVTAPAKSVAKKPPARKASIVAKKAAKK
ncbi:MAG TPA: HU family DNA-binding protein [Acidimicrobiales bacterium]|nr:HU family DNA-binding protein [Acidimicrobiales bacterium]